MPRNWNLQLFPKLAENTESPYFSGSKCRCYFDRGKTGWSTSCVLGMTVVEIRCRLVAIQRRCFCSAHVFFLCADYTVVDNLMEIKKLSWLKIQYLKKY